MALNATFNVSGANINALLANSETVGATLGAVEVVTNKYTGSLTITPTQQAQTVPCAGNVMQGDLTVEAIPSNYGKISYSGFVLRVE